METDNYATDIAQICSSGFFYFFDPEWKPEDLRIRVRIYRPVEDDFELFVEQDAEIAGPLRNDPATLQFLVNLKPKQAPKPGRYLCRADCFDKSGEEEKLLASNAVFITFVDVAKSLTPPEKVSNRSQSARTHRFTRTTRIAQDARR
jgi:hypothetical protein